MNSNDYKIIKELLDISERISSMYDKLYELELSGKKNTVLYDNIIEFILEEKNNEDRIYSSIPLNKQYAYIDYLSEIDKDLEHFVKNDRKLFEKNGITILCRIINRLEKLINDNDEKMYEEMFEEMREEMYEEMPEEARNNSFTKLDFMDDDKETYEETKNEYLSNFLDDALNLSVIFADKLSFKIKNSTISADLKRLKYINAFTRIEIEDDFLYSKFNLRSNLIDISVYRYLPYISSSAFENITNIVKDILKEKHKTLEDYEKMYIKISLIKAYTLFLDDSEIEKVIKDLNEKNIKICSLKNRKIKQKIIKMISSSIKQ